MIKEGCYKCIGANYVVQTRKIGRVPVLKSYMLKYGGLYQVDKTGNLEIPDEGYAKITDEIEKILVPYESKDEIKHWNDIHTQASIHIMASVIGIQKPGVSIDLNRVASVAITAADALVDELKRRKS